MKFFSYGLLHNCVNFLAAFNGNANDIVEVEQMKELRLFQNDDLRI